MRTSFVRAALVACLAPIAVAQAHTGGIRGTVRDESGPVLGVAIELINESTRFAWTASSNRSGEYAFSRVAPGIYSLRAAVAGFKPTEKQGIRIGTQEFLTMPDIVLELNQREEQVTVLGDAPLVDNASASVGATLDRKTLETIPSAGRNAFYLSVLTPNVLHTSDPQFVRQQDQTSSSALSLAGGPKRANNYTLDGVSITDLRNRATIIPSFEATEEVRVQLATYDAEMGRTGGGVFNTTTRSGANAWHGSLLGQTRPKWGQSRLYFDQRACDAAQAAGQTCSPKPDTRYRLFGGSLGGPIRKDKTFFWASFEGYRSTTARNAVLNLPTELERRGDFSQSGVTIYDPLTTRPDGQGGYVRDPFPGNVIPANRLNPVALAMLPYLPLPLSGNNRSAVAEIKDKALQATFRLDHRFSSKYQASLTYAWYDSEEPEARYYGGEPGSNPGDPGGGALYRRVHVVALNNTIAPSSDTVWSVRYGFTSFADDELPVDFDPAGLGFAPGFIDAIPYRKFPLDRDRRVRWTRRPQPAGHHLLLAQRQPELVEARRAAQAQGGRGLPFDRDEAFRGRPVERQLRLQPRLHTGARPGRRHVALGLVGRQLPAGPSRRGVRDRRHAQRVLHQLRRWLPARRLSDRPDVHAEPRA